MPSQQTFRITATARLFAFLALGAPVLWYQDSSAILSLIAIGLIWADAIGHEQRHWLTVAPLTPIAEAALIGVVCGVSLGPSPTIVLALAVPPFVAAVRDGVRAMGLALAAQLVGVVAMALLVMQQLTAEQSFSVFTWSMAGLGLGMIGGFVRAAALGDDSDEITPYLDAQHLIRQLINLSDDLESGLDVTSLGGTVLSAVGDELPTCELALYVPRGEALVPLITKTAAPDADLSVIEALAFDAWAHSATVADGTAFAFPLGESAVVAGTVADDAGLADERVAATVDALAPTLRLSGVQLDTALLFADFRDAATADVRRRLAREMHDGVAQDIASLGYLVDALASRPADEKQARALEMLRTRITAIVAEVRQSVLTLRTSIGEAESLGTAIGTVARHLSESSQIPIQVTLDERAARLRPEVEAELFRITQEAMNNAIKHARCSLIEVNCQVHAPDALITVTDDGQGLQQGRTDSYGLKIMRERARLVDADLTIADRPAGGLVVAVRIAR